jgi:ribosome maturation factor RimP
LNGQKRFKGWISGCSETAVTLEEDGLLKEVPFDILQKAKLAPFDEEKTPKPKHVEAKYTDFSAPPSAAVETSPCVELTEEV